jgi:hypothetical protein
MPRLPGAVRFQLQDCEDRDRKWFIRLTEKRLGPHHRPCHGEAASTPYLAEAKLILIEPYDDSGIYGLSRFSFPDVISLSDAHLL